MNREFNIRIEKAKKAIEDAEYILLGGGAGLSDAAGLEYSGKSFKEDFAPFIEKYGFTDLYSAGFYEYETQEERWAYWAKHISMMRYGIGATKLYMDLFQLVKDKKHFVISTNVESQFEIAGFPEDRVFEVQGDLCYIQCAKGCHDKVYYNESLIKEMAEKIVDCRIPSKVIPKCPVCGGEMDVNLRCDEYFVQDKDWYKLNNSYNDFLKESEGKKIVYIELGVGFNTPGIIRYPFERMTYNNQNATLIRLNKEYHQSIKENEDKTIPFYEDMQKVISEIMK